MTNQDPALAHVALAVPTEHLAELLQHVGGFAAKYNVALEVVHGSAPETKRRRYNPDRVTYLPDGPDGAQVAVVTGASMAAFAQEKGMAKGLATQLLTFAGNDARTEEKQWLETILYRPDRTAPPVGIRADSMPTLAEMLTTHDFLITRVAKKITGLVTSYSKELFLED